MVNWNCSPLLLGFVSSVKHTEAYKHIYPTYFKKGVQRIHVTEEFNELEASIE